VVVGGEGRGVGRSNCKMPTSRTTNEDEIKELPKKDTEHKKRFKTPTQIGG